MRIGSNAGHTISGNGRGAIGLIDESICTRQIHKYFSQGMLKLGHEVFDCTIEKSTNYLFEAVNLANKQKLDYAISHHLNHVTDPSAHGVEVWVYDMKDKETVAMAQKICDEIAKLGFKNRGVKEKSTFYWLRKTTSESLIIEYLFCSNSKDVSLYNPEKLSNAVIKALTGKVPGETNSSTNNSVGPSKYKNGDYSCKAKVVRVNSNLNVREQRNTNSEIIGKLSKDSIIQVEYCLDNWFSTYHLGKLGFVCGDYIDLLK